MKPRRDPKPNPLGVAALEGVLDAVEKGAVDSGLNGSASAAMRAIFGMLLGVALDEKKGVTLSLEGMDPVHISKVDAQHVAMKSLTDLTRLEAEHAVSRLAETKSVKFETVGDSLSVRAANVLYKLFGIVPIYGTKGIDEEHALLDLTPAALRAKLVALSVERRHPVTWLLRSTRGCGNVVTKEIVDWIGGGTGLG
jgi:hypothetical protein